jgi:hypothetical protein
MIQRMGLIHQVAASAVRDHRSCCKTHEETDNTPSPSPYLLITGLVFFCRGVEFKRLKTAT